MSRAPPALPPSTTDGAVERVRRRAKIRPSDTAPHAPARVLAAHADGASSRAAADLEENLDMANQKAESQAKEISELFVGNDEAKELARAMAREAKGG